MFILEKIYMIYQLGKSTLLPQKAKYPKFIMLDFKSFFPFHPYRKGVIFRRKSGKTDLVY